MKKLKEDIKKNINFWFKLAEIVKWVYIILVSLGYIFSILSMQNSVLFTFGYFMGITLSFAVVLFGGFIVVNSIKWKGFMLLTNYEIMLESKKED